MVTAIELRQPIYKVKIMNYIVDITKGWCI